VADAVRITDLAHPDFTPEVAEIRELLAAMGEAVELDSASLHRQAAAEVGLTDFGARDYEARLDVLLGALREVPGLDGVGRFGYHTQVLQLLKNRLLLTDLLVRHPEIHEVELAPPIVIAGLPRKVPAQRTGIGRTGRFGASCRP